MRRLPLARGGPRRAAPAAAAPIRIAVIDVERLVRDSALGKEAFNRVKKLNDDKKAEADRFKGAPRHGAEAGRPGQALADEKREPLQKQYQEKAIDFKSFQENASRDLDQAQKKELADLERRVFPVITQLGKESGYTLIFNKFQSGLVFADDAVDITDDVLKRLQHDGCRSARRGGEGAGGRRRPQRKPLRHRRPTKKPVAAASENRGGRRDRSATARGLSRHRGNRGPPEEARSRRRRGVGRTHRKARPSRWRSSRRRSAAASRGDPPMRLTGVRPLETPARRTSPGSRTSAAPAGAAKSRAGALLVSVPRPRRGKPAVVVDSPAARPGALAETCPSRPRARAPGVARGARVHRDRAHRPWGFDRGRRHGRGPGAGWRAHR